MAVENHGFRVQWVVHRLGARMLDGHLEMILQVFADGREVVHDVDTERAQLVRVPSNTLPLVSARAFIAREVLLYV